MNPMSAQTQNLLDREQDLAGRTLFIGALRGYWTIEQLDQPSTQWSALERDRETSNRRRLGNGRTVACYPPGKPWVNLARQYLARHPKECEQLLAQHLEAEPQELAHV
jgi:hypothetical protein